MTAPRWLRQPAVHFALLGGCLFALDAGLGRALGRAAPAREPIEIGAAQVEALRRDWLDATGRAPEPAELEALIDDAIDRELLYREARALGLHRIDPVVRRRLVRNMRFVESDPQRSDDELFDEAMALGMERTDVVVRRRLITLMELQIRDLARAREPTEAELEAELARHAERYRRPARVRLSHVFLSRDARGAALEADARALAARLAAEVPPPDRAAGLGDPFLLGHALPLRSERDLARSFGPQFAAAAIALAPGGWHGPLASSYGRHLVWVHERREAEAATLASVRRELREAVLEQRARVALREALREMRARYAVSRPPAGPA